MVLSFSDTHTHCWIHRTDDLKHQNHIWNLTNNKYIISYLLIYQRVRKTENKLWWIRAIDPIMPKRRKRFAIKEMFIFSLGLYFFLLFFFYSSFSSFGFDTRAPFWIGSNVDDYEEGGRGMWLRAPLRRFLLHHTELSKWHYEEKWLVDMWLYV